MCDKIIYTPANAKNPHMNAIDYALMKDDGSYIGLFSKLTPEELTEQYGVVNIMDADKFAQARDESYITAPEVIDHDTFDLALNALPPLQWGTWNGVESFRLSEFYTGNITNIYARSPDGRCWKFRDNGYQSGELVAQKVLAAANATPILH